MPENSKIHNIFDSFKDLHIVIIGDVMVDKYVKGKITGNSPEADAGILREDKSWSNLGGAANVAANIQALGANPYLFSVIGKDQDAELFVDLMQEQHMNTSFIQKCSKRQTTSKSRFLDNEKQILRLDNENCYDISEKQEEILFRQIKWLTEQRKIDAILFQDYNKGVLTKNLINRVINLAKDAKVVLAVDPKVSNFYEYKEVDLFKPNRRELEIAFGSSIPTDKIKTAIKEIQDKLKAKNLLVTLSDDGNVFSSETEYFHTSSIETTIKDVSGAGDSVFSIASLCLASGVKPEDLTRLSILAGTQVCNKLGVSLLEKDQLIEDFLSIQNVKNYAG